MKKNLLHILILLFVFLYPSIIHAVEEKLEQEKDRLLVIPLKAKGGISQDEVTLLTDILSIELYRSGKFIILNRDDMKAVLTEKEFEIAMGCEDNVCLLENVAKLAVNKLIAGNIGKLGEKYIITIRLINEDGENEIMEKETCACEIDELDKAIEQVAYTFLKYLGGDVAQDGSIHVESEPRGAKIYLDGNDIGTTPDSIRRIVSGTHKVEVKKDGYMAWSKKVDVEAGEEASIFVRLEVERQELKEDKSLIEEEWKRLEGGTLAEDKSRWLEWQNNMVSAYNEVLKRDRDAHLRIHEKARSWKRIIEGFSQDNPYSTEDNRIRRHALKRLEEFRRLSGKPGRPPMPPRPPKDRRR